jgi:DNA replication protein DnaC
MAFEVKYYQQAEQEIKQRRDSNRQKLEQRRREIEQQFPQYAELRSVMAATGVKIVRAVMNSSLDDISRIQQENTKAAARIKELLMNGKYPADYLQGIYSCKICRDTGKTDNSWCDCFKHTVRRLAARELNSKSPLSLTGFESFDVNLYPDIVQNEFNVREVMRSHFEYCKNYAENFHLPDEGLLFTGKTGLGKTHLSLAIAGRVIDGGFNVVYGSAPDLFRKIENEHFGREQGGTMDSLQNAQLLVLDDIGAEFESSFYVSAFYNLVNSRMNLGLPLIINTNLNMSELEKRYKQRIVSRLLTMKILKFFGEDIRLKRRRAK